MSRPLCLLILLVVLCASCASDAEQSAETDDGLLNTRVVSTFDGGASADFEGDSIFFFRVFDAVLLEDGGVVLGITGAENRLVYLDSFGRAEAVVGRSGEGPGEFQSILGLYPIDSDRVGAFDLRARRLTIASRDGIEDMVSTASIPINEEPLGFMAPDLIVTTPRVSNQGFANSAEPGAVRSYQRWRLFDQEATAAGAFDGFVEPPSKRVMFENPGGPNVGTSPGGSCLPEAHHGVAGHGLWVGEGHTQRLALFDSIGQRIIEISDSSRATVTRATLAAFDEMVDQYESEVGSFTESSVQAVRNRIGEPGDPVPSAWSRIEVDPTGRVWLERAVCFESPTRRVWDIYSDDGRKLGAVAFPDDTRLLAVRGDRVLVAETDPLGVELLKMLEVAY